MKFWIAIAFFVSLGFTGVFLPGPEPFLKAGSEFSYLYSDESGKQRIQTIHIDSVKQTGASSAVYASNYYEPTESSPRFAFVCRYWCDSLNWYCDSRNPLQVTPQTIPGIHYSYETDSLIYPLTMRAGDTLMPSFARKIVDSKLVKYEDTELTWNRKVVAWDTVALSCGPVEAFRIDYRVLRHNASYYSGDSLVYDTDFTCSEWFSPLLGVVKWEQTSKSGVRSCILQSWK